MRPLLRTVAIAAAALVPVLWHTPVHAQRIDGHRLLDVSMDLGDQSLSATIREGGSFRVTLRETDEYVFVPVFPPGSPTVTMAVYRGVANRPGTRHLVERLELTVGRAARLRTNGRVQVLVTGIRPGPAVASLELPPVKPASYRFVDAVRTALQPADQDQCCVCCGSACACACGVKMSCGSCCMPGCCGGGGASAPAGSRDALARFVELFGSGCSRAFPAQPIRPVTIASR